MLTIDLEPELETALNAMAEKEHSSPGEIAKRVIGHYLKENQTSELLIDIVAGLPEIACFKDKDPLELQRAWRDEWN
jgi:predicted transcriptional regulator